MNDLAYKEIASGVKMLCVQSGKFKTDCIRLDFYLPIGEKLAAQNVLCGFMGHTSKKYPTFKAFNAKTEELYGADFYTDIATVGEKVRIRFAIEAPSDRFALHGESISADALDFLLEIVKNPNCENGCFNGELTEREVKFTLQALEAEKNDKRSYAVSRLRFLMCENEPYGIDREKLEKEVSALDGRQLFEAYEDMLSTATVVLTACGELNEKALEARLTAFAEGIKSRNTATLSTVYIEKAEKIRYFKEKMEVGQAKLVIGLRSGMLNPDDDYFAFRIMTDVFGGGPYSRLFTNVREKMSLCYYCSARLYREKGIIFIQCGVEAENYEKALEEILNQLEIMKKGEFTPEELEFSKKALSDAFRGVEDSPNAVCTYYGSQVFDGELLGGEEYAQRLMGVTAEQVKKCAERVSVDSVYLLYGGEGENE